MAQPGSENTLFKRLAICFIAFPTVAVVGRVWSRLVVSRRTFGWDDGLCVVALVLNLGLCAVTLVSAQHGLGDDLAEQSFSDIETGLKYLFISYYLYNAAVTFVKVSALSLYSRIFGYNNRTFNWAVCVGHALSALYLIWLIPQIALLCQPSKKYWNLLTKGHCVNDAHVYLAAAVWDVTLDLYILILPMPMLWGLQMKFERKLTVAVALIIGYSSLIASTGGLASIVKYNEAADKGLLGDVNSILEWSLVEPGVGIIGICIPPWYALVRRLRRGGAASLLHSRELDEPKPNSGGRSYSSSLRHAGSWDETEPKVPHTQRLDGVTVGDNEETIGVSRNDSQV